MIRSGRRAVAVVVTAVALLGLPLATSAAHAAPAAPPGKKCPATTLKQDINRADVVFRGEVKKARPIQGTGKQRTRTYKVVSDPGRDHTDGCTSDAW